MRRTTAFSVTVGVALGPLGCSLTLNRSCDTSNDCVSGECRNGICQDDSPLDASAREGAVLDAWPDVSVLPGTLDSALEARSDTSEEVVGTMTKASHLDTADAAGDEPTDVASSVDLGTEAGDEPTEDASHFDAGDAQEAATSAGDASSDGDVASIYPCGPAWAEWPMPQPVGVTVVAGDPLYGLPNPQSYDTTNADVVIDGVTQLVWQKVPTPDVLTFPQAQAFCATLELAGRTDWRLPSRIELISTVDFTTEFPAIDGNVFPATPPEAFWTCTLVPWNSIFAWVVDYNLGQTALKATSLSSHVRCVAGSTTTTPPPARYALDVPGEVRDVKTGLTWRADSLPPSNWSSADRSCLSLGAGWRLPSVTEIETLLDESQAAAAVDPIAFPDRIDGNYWTSSLFRDASMFWFAGLGTGTTYPISSTTAYYARCVR